MNKKPLLILLACFTMLGTFAQTLFTYGNEAVDVKDFIRAYNKNNTGPIANRSASMREYLDLYINSRLKIREAYDRKYDTLPQIRMDIRNLRSQIADNYMVDPSLSKRMVSEAFTRSLKDINVAHIFISFFSSAAVMDTTAAILKKDEVMRRLAKGEDFQVVAQQTSDDPAAKSNKGHIGYITVFTLPYQFENAIYSTSIGKHSSAIRSQSGFHIFKNLGERKAVGKMKARQILFAIPPDADGAAKKHIAFVADSVYKKLLAGADFSQAASAISNDYISAATGGNMQDISVGQYDPAFEQAIWGLPKNGAITKPFLSSHGWHIVKRVSVVPVVSDPLDKNNQQAIQDKVTADARWRSSRDFIYDRLSKITQYEKSFNSAEFRNWADSMLDRRALETGNTFSAASPLFKIGDSVYTSGAWLNFAGSYRFRPDGSGTKPHAQVMAEFVQSSMINYYRDHLEDFNEEFNDQMNEFKDGNLFFEIMQQEVWNKAQTDSNSLRALYETNRKNYTWKQSADAVVFFCSDEQTAKTLQTYLAKNAFDWRKATELYSEKVVADSARYEWEQIPNLNKALPRAGMMTAPLVTMNDNTVSFAYIIRVYMQSSPRTFEEARSMVVNDYQALIEKQWIERLKSKYPVVVNQEVLNAVLKN